MIRPTNNPLSRGYSQSHAGYDFRGLNLPDEVKAGDDGEIIQRVDLYVNNWQNTGTLTTRDYGNYIKIKHTDGSFELHAHLAKGSALNLGTKVKAGQIVARIGNTGNSTGPHVHSEYRNSDNINIPVEFQEVIISDTTEIDKLKQTITDLTKEVVDKNTQISNYVAQVQGWEKKYEECNTQRIEAGASADGFRKQLNDFVAQLASILGTRQETVEIITAVETTITYEDKATQLDRQLALQAKEYQATIDSLEKEIATLKSTTEADKAKYDAKILQLEGTIKELKYSNVTPTQPTVKYSILELLKKLLGI